MSAQYRPNVAVLVTNGQGQVLLCSRFDDQRRVQTVQGGIDPGEEPRQAAEREVYEEIGLTPEQYRVIGVSETKYRYDWPESFVDPELRAIYCGQEQQYFLIAVKPDTTFKLDTHNQEFEGVRWGSPRELIDLAWERKRPGLEGALREFGLLAGEA